MTQRQCFRYVVSGRVQGVFYRASARDAAQQLGLCGWVCNTPDGKVEAVACGEPQALRRFVEWLWRGPAEAQVTEVASSAVDDAGYTDFAIRR